MGDANFVRHVDISVPSPVVLQAHGRIYTAMTSDKSGMFLVFEVILYSLLLRRNLF